MRRDGGLLGGGKGQGLDLEQLVCGEVVQFVIGILVFGHVMMGAGAAGATEAWGAV